MDMTPKIHLKMKNISSRAKLFLTLLVVGTFSVVYVRVFATNRLSKNPGYKDQVFLLVNESYEERNVTEDKDLEPGDFPPIYVITPTYRRAEQIPELVRLGQTLKHVKNLHWLVIEDEFKHTKSVSELLHKLAIPHEHLLAPMPQEYRIKKGPKPKGVSNRNRGLEWIRANASDGVFYFADDDNTYDIDIFEEMRYTKKISMWPVGLLTNTKLSTPIVHNKTLVGFYDGYIRTRRYPVDMAGFAVGVKFFLKRPKASMPYESQQEEEGFLRSLQPFKYRDIELKANYCSKILVWHTKTLPNGPPRNFTEHEMKELKSTNVMSLKDQVVVSDERAYGWILPKKKS